MKDQLDKIEAQLVRGESSQALIELEAVKRTEIPSNYLANYANLCWRLNQPERALSVLAPVVRPRTRDRSVASDAECAEYAQCLIRIGAYQEAKQVLASVTESIHLPLYEASLRVSCWDYAGAKPYLLRYLKQSAEGSYQEMVAQTNLLITETYLGNFEFAEEKLEQMIERTHEKQWRHLEGVLWAHAALVCVLQRKFRRMEEYLEKSHPSLRGGGSLEEFFSRKWRAIAGFVESLGSSESVQALSLIRKEALQRGYWETLRQIDRFVAVILTDKTLAKHLYFGTPFSAYREKLLDEYPRVIELPRHYPWQLQPMTKKPLNLLIHPSEFSRFRSGKLLHRTLQALCSDFYRPLRMATLYCELFPEEWFNPNSSPNRVYQAIGRLRKFFEERKVPLEVRNDPSGFRLVATGPCTLLVPQPTQTSATFSAQLRSFCSRDSFTLSEMAPAMKMSRRTLTRLVRESVEKGELEKIGSGRTTRYQFPKGS